MNFCHSPSSNGFPANSPSASLRTSGKKLIALRAAGKSHLSPRFGPLARSSIWRLQACRTDSPATILPEKTSLQYASTGSLLRIVKVFFCCIFFAVDMVNPHFCPCCSAHTEPLLIGSLLGYERSRHSTWLCLECGF